MSEWQPISTAPKGRSFWGWNEKWFEPEICRWESGSFMPRSAIEKVERGQMADYFEPTHWRERTDIPAPPPTPSN